MKPYNSGTYLNANMEPVNTFGREPDGLKTVSINICGKTFDCKVGGYMAFCIELDMKLFGRISSHTQKMIR